MWVPGSILLSALPTNLAGWIFLKRTGSADPAGLHNGTVVGVDGAERALCAGDDDVDVYHRTGHLLVRCFWENMRWAVCGGD